MASTDSRIVTIKFDNAQFKREATTTMTALDKLKQNMNFSSATSTASRSLSGFSGIFSRLKSHMNIRDAATGVKTQLGGISGVLSRFGVRNPFAKTTQGLGELQTNTSKFSMTGLTGGITEVNKGWLAMTTVALTALSNITTAVMQSGAQWAKSMSLDPIIAGFTEYETKMGSIQTIMSNTGLEGEKGLGEVTHALDELNHYADQTIYNFGEMARNIGTFTAAGVDLDTSVASIKGIANLAAISGSTSAQASTAMYQLSQALASGKVSLMDWNSVVNAGMGGKVFQQALARTATTMGTLNDAAVKTTGPMEMLSIRGQSFRESISAATGGESWLTSDVLTSTLKQLSGDMTTAELRAEGFTDAQVKAIQEMGRTGVDAATKVKTLTQLIDTTKEAISSGWAKTFELIFGNFNEAKKLFTDISGVVSGFIGDSADARNEMFAEWGKMGGRDLLVKGLGNAFNALMDVIVPIKEAFREIFPAKTADDLMSMTEGFVDFTERLRLSDETMENLKRTFSGVFAVFHTIGSIIGGVIGLFGRLGGAVSDGSGGFLDFTGGIGDFLVSLDKALTKGGALERFFDGLGDVLAVPLRVIRSVAGWIGDLFSGFDEASAKVVTGSVDRVKDSLEPVSEIGKDIGRIFGKLGGWLSDAASAVGEVLGDIGNAIADSIGPGTFDRALDAVNVALLGGIVLMLKRFFSSGTLNIDVGTGLFQTVKDSLGAVTEQLQLMQTSIKADIILKIAFALGILVASIAVLSSIDPKDLAIGLGGLALGFAGLQIALVKLSTAISYLGTLKLPFIVASLIGLAAAMVALSIAMKIMSTIDFADMLRGLFGLGAALFIMQKALDKMDKAGAVRAAGALLILSVALNAIAIALKIFATMDLEEIGKGLLAMAGSLGVIAGAMHLMPANMLVTAAGLVAVGVALNLIATSLKIFGSMDIVDIGKGLVALGGALLIIAGAMNLMPIHLPITAAGLVAVAFALTIMSGALKVMGSMSWEEIAKSMVVLAGSLAILAIALNSMLTALPGAAALVVAAAGLAILAPVLIAMGSMSWEMIAKGLVALAGALTIIGIAGYLLAPVVPAIMGLGLGLVLLGAGFALAGAGAIAFASAFTSVVATGQRGVKVFGDLMGKIIKSIPNMMKAFGKGLAELAKQVKKAGPDFVKAWTAILGAFLDGIIKNTPKMGRAFLTMLETALRVVKTAAPGIIRAGLDLIVGFLQAISDKLPRLIDLGVEIVVKLLNGIQRNDQKLAQEGAETIISFINAVSRTIENNSTAIGAAGGRLGVAIIRGMADAIRAGLGVVVDAAKDMADAALGSAMDFLGISSPSKAFRDKVGKPSVEGMAKGLKDRRGRKKVKDSIVAVSKEALRRARRLLKKDKEYRALVRDLQPRWRSRKNDDILGVSREAIKRTRKILREEHHKDLAYALRPKRTIKPILDLSDVKKKGKDIDRLIGRPINPYVSSGRARYISADKAQAMADVNRATPDDAAAATAAPVQFVQHNHSPKALNPVEVYRRTNNQLSLAKEALKKNDSR